MRSLPSHTHSDLFNPLTLHTSLIHTTHTLSDLFKTAMYRYMKKCPKPYMHIVRANVDGDWEALVRTRPVGRWQETLALLATYTAQVCVCCVLSVCV